MLAPTKVSLHMVVTADTVGLMLWLGVSLIEIHMCRIKIVVFSIMGVVVLWETSLLPPLC